MRKLLQLAVAVGVMLIAGCYHAVVNTGQPTSGETIKKEWAHSFLAGLVPPSAVETASQCANGIARVETKLSFLNQVANVLTLGIYTPMTIEVHCAAPGDGDESAQLSVRPDAADAREFLTEAALRSAEMGTPVFVNMN
jgi:hypothetical protein